MKDQYLKHLDSINEYAKLLYQYKMNFRKAVEGGNKAAADRATYECTELARSWRPEYSGVEHLSDKEVEEILLLQELSSEEKEVIKEIFYGSQYARGNVNIVKLIGTARAMIPNRYFEIDGKLVDKSVYNVREKSLQYLVNNPIRKD